MSRLVLYVYNIQKLMFSVFRKKSFLVQGNIIKELEDKATISSMEELSKALANQKNQKNIQINPKVFEILKKELGDYEILV